VLPPREAGGVSAVSPPLASATPLLQRFADSIIVLWGWRRLLVSFLAGAVSALAFAPFNAFPVLWLSVPVLVWLLDGAESDAGTRLWRRFLPAAAVGFFFGFGFFLAGLWWVGVAFLTDGGAFLLLLPLAVVALPAGLALFWAVAAGVARLLWAENWSRVFVFAAVFSGAEWLRGHLFTGFPWNAFGYALTPGPLMMQSASLIGIWGVTLVAFIVFAAPVFLLPETEGEREGGRAAFTAAVILLGAHLVMGLARLPSAADALVPGIHLRLVQPSIPQDERWATERADDIMSRYVSLSESGAKGMRGVTHLIWPESAFPFLLTEKPEALAAIADLLPPGATLVTGAARGDRSSGRLRVFNSIYVIDDRADIVDVYDKVHLVPFGEYLPFGNLLRMLGLRQLIALPSGFAAGTRLHTLHIPGAPGAGPLVCYEVIFPGSVVAPGARPGWLVNVTNDAWYGETPGPYQHFLEARVRAVEEGLPLVRAANSGISAIIDPYGRVVTSLSLGSTGVMDGGLPAALPPTLYARFGDVVFFGFLVVDLIVAVLARIYYSRLHAQMRN
jgi:apolipoprotein N-acyltransferase